MAYTFCKLDNCLKLFTFIIAFLLITNGLAWSKLIAGKSNSTVNSLMKDEHHGIKMGQVFVGCDDGQTDLNVDWDESPINYTCYHPKTPFRIKENVTSVEECDKIPFGYYPQHYCMDDEIEYEDIIPTYGDHRPLWPIFGEYKFVPPQRWLHNIEHGAVVMLFHPCAHPAMVNRLRALVTRCIRKHVITRYNLMTEDYPLALVAWGCRLRMNYVDPKTVVTFIKKRSMKGPEGNYPKEGQFSKYLIKMAKPPQGSDYKDSNICPGL